VDDVPSNMREIDPRTIPKGRTFMLKSKREGSLRPNTIFEATIAQSSTGYVYLNSVSVNGKALE